jgi:hypothetical protein
VDQHADEIPGFKLELAEVLKTTTETGLGNPIFACHQSHMGREVVCRGWLVRHGWDSIAIRLMLANGRMQRDELYPGDDWPELHESFDGMIAKLRADMAAK